MPENQISTPPDAMGGDISAKLEAHAKQALQKRARISRLCKGIAICVLAVALMLAVLLQTSLLFRGGLFIAAAISVLIVWAVLLGTTERKSLAQLLNSVKQLGFSPDKAGELLAMTPEFYRLPKAWDLISDLSPTVGTLFKTRHRILNEPRKFGGFVKLYWNEVERADERALEGFPQVQIERLGWMAVYYLAFATKRKLVHSIKEARPCWPAVAQKSQEFARKALTLLQQSHTTDEQKRDFFLAVVEAAETIRQMSLEKAKTQPGYHEDAFFTPDPMQPFHTSYHYTDEEFGILNRGDLPNVTIADVRDMATSLPNGEWLIAKLQSREY